MEKPTDLFYSDAADYWARIPPTINGMLGGFGHISPIDIQGSKVFLRQLFRSKNPPERKYALDCGAGIGRISKHLLLGLFNNVDLLEQNSNFLEQARTYIGPTCVERVGNLYQESIRDFIPDSNKYDVIWIQWVLGHLTDDDFIKFFDRCKNGLTANGLIIVKENVTSSDKIEMDKDDSSMTRPFHLIKDLFEKAGLECFRQMKQTSFPKELYNVYMFALRPKILVQPKLETLWKQLRKVDKVNVNYDAFNSIYNINSWNCYFNNTLKVFLIYYKNANSPFISHLIDKLSMPRFIIQ